MSHVKLHCSELLQKPKVIQIHLKTYHKAKICHTALGLVTPGKPSYCKTSLQAGHKEKTLKAFQAYTPKNSLVQYTSRFYSPLNYSVSRFKFLCSFQTKTILSWANFVTIFIITSALPSCKPPCQFPQNTWERTSINFIYFM